MLPHIATGMPQSLVGDIVWDTAGTSNKSFKRYGE